METETPRIEGLTMQESSSPPRTFTPDIEEERKPESPGRSSESTPDAFVQALRAEVNNQQRSRSPYSRSHLRSYSGPYTAPQMTRTRSLPLYESGSNGRSPSHSPVRPSSPLRPPPAAARASPRRSLEESRPPPGLPVFMEDIQENAELDVQPRPAPTLEPAFSNTFPQTAYTLPMRSNSGRRRPHSPLHSLSNAYVPPPPSSPLSIATYPMAGVPSRSPSSTPPPPNAARFNESFPGAAPTMPASSSSASIHHSHSFSSASSVPSTPTSFRSRSPSISSLETIPDTPDAEIEAQDEASKEAAQIARLKAAADAEDSEEERRGGRRRFGSADAKNRKRWSVCGGERRDAFEMETIWED